MNSDDRRDGRTGVLNELGDSAREDLRFVFENLGGMRVSASSAVTLSPFVWILFEGIVNGDDMLYADV